MWLRWRNRTALDSSLQVDTTFKLIAIVDSFADYITLLFQKLSSCPAAITILGLISLYDMVEHFSKLAFN